MQEHAPAAYQCPFCHFVHGGETVYNARGDVVYEDDAVLAFVSPKRWPNNPGNVIVIPKQHFENVYTMPDALLAQIMVVGKRVAIAMKLADPCNGTSFRQHNEPAGDQDVWHYHLHVFPRWDGDALYRRHDESRFVPAEERRHSAEKLRSGLKRGSTSGSHEEA
jgi:histidine triad (HIT) family protein